MRIDGVVMANFFKTQYIPIINCQFLYLELSFLRFGPVAESPPARSREEHRAPTQRHGRAGNGISEEPPRIFHYYVLVNKGAKAMRMSYVSANNIAFNISHADMASL